MVANRLCFVLAEIGGVSPAFQTGDVPTCAGNWVSSAVVVDTHASVIALFVVAELDRIQRVRSVAPGDPAKIQNDAIVVVLARVPRDHVQNL